MKITLILVFLFLLRNENFIFEMISNYVSLFILIFGITILLVSARISVFRDLKGGIRVLFNFWKVAVLWMFITPFYDGFEFNFNIFSEGLYHDYRYVLFATLPFAFVSDSMKPAYDKLWDILTRFGILVGIVALVVVDKSFSGIGLREGTFSLPYYLWWVVIAVYPYSFLRSIYLNEGNKGKYLIILHLLLSFVFLKRAGIVGAILYLILGYLFSGKVSKLIMILLIFLISIMLSAVIFQDYLDLLLNRFIETGEDLESWDRNLEVDEYFSQVSTERIFLGYGINNYIKMFYVGVHDRGVNALHIGFYNIIYKGGVVLLAYYTVLFYNIIRLFKYIDKNSEIKIGFIIGIVYFISLAYEGSWSYVPTHFFLLLAIYRGIYVKNKVKRVYG
jgi:hypothetical protein